MKEEVVHAEQKQSRKPSILFTINLLILWALIIVYCFLSQSIYSSVSLAILIISVILFITEPSFIDQTPEIRVPSKERIIKNYPVQRIIWAIFSALTIVFQIIKVVIYFTSIIDNMDEDEKLFVQVNSQTEVFVPIILIPFGIIAAFNPPKYKTLQDYKTKINPFSALPLYLILCTIILLIQIFSVSITGLTYFAITLYLFWMKSFNFKEKQFQVILIVIQSVNCVTLTATYLATCQYLKTTQSVKEFEFVGVNSLNEFSSDTDSRGHFICEILLSLMCAYLNRLAIYQSFNRIYVDIYCPKINDLQHFQQDIRIDEKDFTNKHRARNYHAGTIETKRQSQGSLRQDLLNKRISQKVKPLRQQVEMKDMFQRDSFRSDNHDEHEHTKPETKQLQQNIFLQQILNFEDEKVDQTQQQQKNRLYKQKKKTINYKQIKKAVLNWVSIIFNFLNSPEFSLRLIQIISIVVIQRYNNIYSFVNLIWLFFVASSENLFYIRIFTAFIIMPLEIVNFVITYFYNIPNSPAASIHNAEIYGFQMSNSLWLDILIFNFYLHYLILFVKSYNQIRQAMSKKIKRSKRKPNLWEVILAFIFRYTYLFTLAAIFFLGFSKPTIINIIYVSLFLIFFSNGDNLIFVTKQKRNKKRQTITTFSKHYWFIIVSYTLLCILGKYLYFLFFNGQVSDWLAPTGINEEYNWSFNFSLSSVCLSNTTPFFLIFVLAQIQIMIYRSYIYTNYSFSIMADFVAGTSFNAQTRASRLKRGFIDFVIVLNELYYQSLYYVSGFIIIVCSYRWSLIGLAIIVLTCFGILRSFNKKMLGIVLFLNLAFLFLNYLVLLINDYEIITQAIGKGFVDNINQISLFIGFSLAKDSYASLFILNIIIFYFCVICYGLSNILEIKQFQNVAISQLSQSSSSSRRRSAVEEHRPFVEQTIVDSEIQDYRFAQNYKRDVIESTKKFYSQNLIVKYKWMRNIAYFLRLFFTDLVAIFVIVECLYFRLSVSMFFFLLVYLIYYFTLFDNIGSIINSSRFNERLQDELNKFSEKEKLLERQEQEQSFIEDRKEIEKTQAFLAVKAQNIILLKSDSRKKIWKYSAILSVTCLVLTYASQFLISEFYTQYVNYSGTQRIKIVLFVLGVNSQVDFGDYVYFYYAMLFINIIQKLTIYFSEQLIQSEYEQKKQKEQKDISNLHLLQNPSYLISCYINEEFIVDSVSKQLEFVNQQKDNQPQMIRNDHFYKQANLLIYFDYKMVMIKMNILYGSIHFMIRFYLWLMLINLYSKGNAFGFAYLIAVLCFWFKEVSFALIRDINKAAIIILLLQYFFLLLDINTVTSPISMPTDTNLSVLQYIIKDPNWVNFLAVSNSQTNNDSYLASFLINSIIIFFTQICYSVYQYFGQEIIRTILQIYQRYENILQKLDIENQDQIEINLKSYKSWWHRMRVFLYQNMLMSSYLIISLLIFMLLSGIHNYLAISLLIIAFLYIYVGIFTKLSESDEIFQYTRYFFRFFNILQFIILFINIVLNMPFIPTTGALAEVLNQFEALTSIEQIVLILFIQVWIDLNASRSFKMISQGYRENNKKKQLIALRCLTFQKNNYLLLSLIREFKEVLSFDNSIAAAMKIIKTWHATTKNDKRVIDYDFQSTQQKELAKKIREEIEQQQIDNDHRQFSVIFKEIATSQTDIPLSNSYYDTLRYVIENIGGVIQSQNLELSAWRFIKEDYDIIVKILNQFDEKMRFISNQILENDNDPLTDVLLDIRKQMPREETQIHQIIKQNFTPRLALRPEKFYQKQKGKFKLLPFIMSNMQVLIVLLLQIYYLANPCLLSLPLIVFAFCYYIIANRKFSYLLLIYIFLLIIAGQIIQIQNLGAQPNGYAVLKFFFYIDTTTNNVSYCLGYLYFIFVIIFINQQVVRYKGNKFVNYEEVQNLQKAFLRILMNEDQKSKLFLWKYNYFEQQILENINPYNIAIYQIDSNLQRLFNTDSSFFSVFSDRKIGVDFYPPIAAIQIFITIYLIFFYPLMTDVKGYSLQESTKYYQFSSDMVIGVLVHVANIVVERFITIQVISRRKKTIIKYIYTIIIFVLFCWFIYYLAPYKPSLTVNSSLYAPSPALIAFSFFYFIYFYLSALQIKYGYKEFKSFNSMMTRRGYTNYYMLSAYTAIPFLYEIKIIMDWTFSSTSLTLYDWFRQFSIYLRAFSSKINYYSATTTTILGQTIPWFYKIIGWVGFILILLIIFGPMILFSGLNPIATPNLVISGSMKLSLQVKNGNTFTLYETSHFSTPPLSYDESLFNAQSFNNISLLQQMTSSQIPQQFQGITYQPFSDSNWAISQPNYNQILGYINQSINSMSSGVGTPYQFQLVVAYQLNRQVVQTISSATSFTYPSSSTYLSLQQLISLNKTMTTCDSPSFFPNFYISLIRLNTINNVYKPRPIIYYNQSSTGQSQQPYLFNVTLNLFCQSGTFDPNVKNTNDVYWGLYLENMQEGLELYVYCDKYQNIIGGYGFTALYTSIILVVAGFIRTLFDGNLPYITYEMNPKPDSILQICQAINTLRVRKQFRQEYLMYYELIDIIRSPQIMKHLSGSYPYLIEQAHEKSLKQQEEKQLEKQKTL